MATANSKGTVEQRVNLVKRGPGEIQHVMLNSVLIKKAQNYGLMTDRFVTNVITEIMQNPRTIMKILPRRDQQEEHEGYDLQEDDEWFINQIHEFKTPLFSVARLRSSCRICKRIQLCIIYSGLYMGGGRTANLPNNSNSYRGW